MSTIEQQNLTLPERLAAFKANFEAGGPPWNAPEFIHPPMHRATAELIASGAAQRALKAGDHAPGFVLKSAEGAEVFSADLLRAGPLVLTFYRGFWCPYCNMDLQALEQARADMARFGAKLVAVSPQLAASNRRAQRENNLNFPILSDPGNGIAALFGLRFTLPDYLADLYKNTLQLDLETVNGDDSWTLPMPARYVIGQDGMIVYAEVNADYTKRPDPSDLLPVLAKLQG